MRVHGQQQGFIALCLYCFGNWEDRLCMHRGGDKISTQGSLLSFTISVCLLLLFTSIAKGRAAPAAGDRDR